MFYVCTYVYAYIHVHIYMYNHTCTYCILHVLCSLLLCVYVCILVHLVYLVRVLCRDIREAFIRAKYETKAWVPRSGSSSETLSKALCVSAATANVQRSYELICGGASVSGGGCEGYVV